MYYGARYYDSYLGRWISADSVVPHPGNPQDLNRFSYTRNNPLVYTDPTGHYLDWGGSDIASEFPVLPNGPTWTAEELADYYEFIAMDGWRHQVAEGTPPEIATVIAETTPFAFLDNGTLGNVTTGFALAGMAGVGSIGGSISLAERTGAVLKGEGYNVSPESWFGKYSEIGKGGRTSVTDRRAISDVIGEFEGTGDQMTITSAQTSTLEGSLGLKQGTLQEGFRISRVEGIADRGPASPLVGNERFLGPGKGLPGGGPELTIETIPSGGGSGITQLRVNVVD